MSQPQPLSKSAILAGSGALILVTVILLATAPPDTRVAAAKAERLEAARLEAVAERIESRGLDCSTARGLIQHLLEVRRHFSKPQMLGTLPYVGLSGWEVSLIKPESLTLYDLRLDTEAARAHLATRCLHQREGTP